MSKPEDVELERFFTVGLGRVWTWRRNRAPKAVHLLKKFIRRHMKASDVIVGSDVNEEIWRRGIEKPPRRIRVKAQKDSEGKVTVSLAEKATES